MSTSYDVIVVGARCAGSPSAMLLARMGHRVLVVDRATFPSDTVSTHVVQAPGVAALDRWGILDKVTASGCPPVETYSFDFGPVTIAGRPRPVAGHSAAYAPRRSVLDTLLIDAADAAGAEVREGFAVDEIIIEGDTVVGIRGRDRGGRTVTERATVVVGADGANSRVVRAVAPTIYHDRPPLQAGVYTYFSGLPVDGFEIFIRPFRGFAAVSTNDGLTMVVAGWPYAEHAANKRDIEGSFYQTIEIAPEFAERVRAATRQARFAGMPVPNYFRTPHGPGWALVGDAGYSKDPITAQGISNAFRDAELCAEALHAALTDTRLFDDAMADYQSTRDADSLAMYEFTCQMATLEPPPPEMQQLFAAMAHDQEAKDDFVSVVAGTVSPAAFLDPMNIGRILDRASVSS
jgi:2-polyprenyl-6-methoxyphenol hydroxylase-like FAD-dependent oxidoreductase